MFNMNFRATVWLQNALLSKLFIFKILLRYNIESGLFMSVNKLTAAIWYMYMEK